MRRREGIKESRERQRLRRRTPSPDEDDDHNSKNKVVRARRLYFWGLVILKSLALLVCLGIFTVYHYWRLLHFDFPQDNYYLDQEGPPPAETDLPCPFRAYNRSSYRVSSVEEADFLITGAQYIRGRLPFLLRGDDHLLHSSQGKICAISPPSRDPGDPMWGSGTNPSFIAKERLQSHLPSSHEIWQVFQRIREEEEEEEGHRDALFIGTSVFKTVPGCIWKEEKVSWKGRNPRTVFYILDDQFRSLASTAIQYERDGVLEQQMLDDARLFLHAQEIWITYKVFTDDITNRDLQYLSPLHLEETNGVLSVTVHHHETWYICCGRNMAILEKIPSLGEDKDGPAKVLPEVSFLAQPDPVQVKSGTVSQHYTTPPSPLLDVENSSGFHGTSAFLIHLPESNEHLGIGHFHRPRHEENPNEYAAYGHHYTHAFFTISAEFPYRLRRLSHEFVFPAKHDPADHAELIQFASGMDLVHVTGRRYVVIGYGINDCEGAGLYVDYKQVQSWLLGVRPGQEVSDHMRKLSLFEQFRAYRYYVRDFTQNRTIWEQAKAFFAYNATIQ